MHHCDANLPSVLQFPLVIMDQVAPKVTATRVTKSWTISAETWLLNFLMVVGLLFGCCPALLISTPRLYILSTKPYKNVLFYYCLATFVMGFLPVLGYFIHSFHEIIAKPVSEIIIIFLANIMTTVVDHLRRFIFL